MSTPNQNDIDTAHALGEVRGQLNAITLLLQSQHGAINQRMDDLQKSIDGRFDTLETRIETLEKNERSTALKAAASGASAAGLAIVVTEALKAWFSRG